jgi:hypothetical protein
MNKEDSEHAAFEEWLSSECPSGDAEEVQRKWESSHEFREWLDDFLAEETTPKPGDRVLAWCDGCLNRRPCRTRKSGIFYEGKECEIHLCRWCLGHRTRRLSAILTKNP